MNDQLTRDLQNFHALLEMTLAEASHHLHTIDDKPAASARPQLSMLELPPDGIGGEQALAVFRERYAGGMTASSGARFWGFVTGGTTPASLMGDWLASSYDINLADKDQSLAPHIEMEALHLLRELLCLSHEFHGVFVSGATTSNFVALAIGREWVGQQRELGYSFAQTGLYGVAPIPVLSAEPHSSTFKALAMLGMGRQNITRIAYLPDNREAMDVADLERHLAALNGAPCIVVASAGTVNTVDFDDLTAIAHLKERYPFWLHVDAAFGGVAACSPRYQHLLAGLDHADSITIDAHKWFNVPYDSAMVFTRHLKLQTSVFQNMASYLPDLGDDPEFFHLTPENSRRFRALPMWFGLMAYGREGFRDIVERDCDMAQLLGEKIANSTEFKLLAPVRMNTVCFTLTNGDVDMFLRRLRDDGKVFMTPTTYKGTRGIRAAFSNWRTEAHDVEIAWEAMLRVLD